MPGGASMSTSAGATAPGPTARWRTSNPRTACGVRGMPKRRARREVKREGREGKGDEHRHPAGQEDGRPRHDRPREARPHPVLRVDRLAGQDPLAGGPAPAVEGKQRRLQRQGGGDRHDRDQKARDTHHPHEGQRHRDQQREAERDRDAGEHDCASGRLHRPDDRVVLCKTGGELLAKPVDDQERVVDGDPEPDQLDQIRRVGRGLGEVRDPVEDPERAHDRARGEDERDRHGERDPEHADQDQDRDRNRDALALLQILAEDRVEVVLDRPRSGDVASARRPVPRRRGARAHRCSPSPGRP